MNMVYFSIYLEFQKNIYFCFIDYTKAFDCVDHNKLWKILKEMGIPDHLTCLLRNLYAGREATVRTGHGTTDWFQIGKGVRQGCILSPCLFNLYAEFIMRNAGLEEAQAGIKIARRNINNLRYADDMILYIENPKDSTRKLLELINKYIKVTGYKINTQKSLAFLYTNNEKTERGIKETIPITIATKRIKYLGVYLPKETKDLYIENYKTLMKETKEDTNRWRNIPCSWIGRINIVKMSILPKAIYRFNAIPIKNTNGIFHRTKTNNFTIYIDSALLSWTWYCSWWRAVLCVVRCLPAVLTSTQEVPITPGGDT